MKPGNAARPWILATVFVVIVLLAAAWFLLISPVLATAADTDAQAESQEQANDTARLEVQQLRNQFENMEEYEAQLAELQEQVTVRQRYADLQRLFAQVAEDHDVVVTSLQFGTAETLTIPVPAAPEPEPSAEGDDEASAEDAAAELEEGTADPAPAATGLTGLFSITVSLTITGDYNDALAALNALQTGADRLVLLTSVSLTSADDDDAGPNGVTLQVAGETFVLADVDTLAEEEVPEDDEELPEVELPQSDDNPLTPAGN